MSRFLAVLGLVITAAYIVFIYWLVGDPLPELKGAPLNNVGDFLAGVFGPVAIFWLILGFFQQGLELRQNNQALSLQAQELKNSVEQQKELVEVTRAQVAAELDAMKYAREEARRSIQPNFVVDGAGGSHSGNNHALRLSVVNIGAPATSVSFQFNGIFRSSNARLASMDKGASHTLTVTLSGDCEGMNDELSIIYLDGAHNPGAMVFVVEVVSTGHSPQLKASRISN